MTKVKVGDRVKIADGNGWVPEGIYIVEQADTEGTPRVRSPRRNLLWINREYVSIHHPENVVGGELL